MLRFKINLDGVEALKKRLSDRAHGAAYDVARTVAKDTDKYVPMLNGVLRGDKTYVENTVEGASIVYDGPYARYLYFGKLMVDPATGSAWAKKSTSKVVVESRDLVFNHANNPQAQSHWFEVSKAVNKDRWIVEAGEALKRHGSK